MLNNTLLNNQEITEEIKEKIKKYLETNDKAKPMRCRKSSNKTEVYRNTILPQETRKSEINHLTLHLQQLEKEEQQQPKKTQS